MGPTAGLCVQRTTRSERKHPEGIGRRDIPIVRTRIRTFSFSDGNRNHLDVDGPGWPYAGSDSNGIERSGHFTKNQSPLCGPDFIRMEKEKHQNFHASHQTRKLFQREKYPDSADRKRCEKSSVLQLAGRPQLEGEVDDV